MGVIQGYIVEGLYNVVWRVFICWGYLYAWRFAAHLWGVIMT